MSILLTGLVLFFATHSISLINQSWRDRMADKLGEQAWQAIYALIALTGFVCIVWGYGLARTEPVSVYLTPTWLRHLAMLLLLPVFPLLLATYLPGRIQNTVKHPMLVATLLWGLAHLLANGMLADLLLFGSFLLWALADLISLRRRNPRAVSGAPPAVRNDLIAVVGGLGLYLVFVIWLHSWLIGVSPVSM